MSLKITIVGKSKKSFEILKKPKFQEYLEYFVNNTLSIVKVVVLSKFIRRQKNIPLQAECVILANGPSLNDFISEHREFLKNKDIFCVNLFPVSEFYADIQPGYFLINAPEMWIDDVDAVHIRNRTAIFEAIANKTQWPLVFFIPFAARRHSFWQDILKKNRHIRIAYYNTTPIEGSRSFVHFCFRHQLGMPRPHNVLIPSIMMALHLQYQRIYLAGTDHSWLKDLWVSDNNQVLLTQKHFYDEHTARAEPMQKLGRDQRKLHEVLTKFMHTFSGYFVLRDYAESIDAKIINITPASYIDAFERMKLS